jgi:lipopolysaccharide transport system ATP-binding protein
LSDTVPQQFPDQPTMSTDVPVEAHDAQSTAEASKEVLICVEGVSKRFCRSLKKSLWYGAQDIFGDLMGNNSTHQLRVDEFWAVNDVSFELRRGECLGLIGHNGAGKTTLLKMLNGLIKPDRGRIEMRGRMGALIALGAGFNPILSGRENIYVNASVLGLSKKQTEAKIDEIIDFAEIREFIDAPVQNYSFGMNVRLGFAVAVILIEPDVLFLDEVLAVGDIGFTIKCLNAVRRLSQNSAVVFVSHNMQFISSFCTRVMIMKQGQCLLDTTEPARGIDHYYSMVNLERQESGTGEASIKRLCLKVDGEEQNSHEPQIYHGAEASLVLHLHIEAGRIGARLHIYIMDEAMSPIVCIPVQDLHGRMLCVNAGDSNMEIPLGPLELCAGKYSFTIGVMDAETAISLMRVQGLLPFRIFADCVHWGKIVRPARTSLAALPPTV